MEKIVSRRTIDGPVVEGVEHKWVVHSPDGFNWGYRGSGPADLALNILLAVTKDREIAWRYHQDFKEEVIANLPWEGGEIRWEDVKKWLFKE